MYIGIIRSKETNEILSCNIFPKDATEEFVKDKVDACNSKETNPCYAEYEFASDDSLTAFLAERVFERVAFANETIQAALDAISEAEMAIRGLRVAKGDNSE